MTVYEFYKFLDKIYPKELSCPWDNDGIMCSRDPDASVRKVLVSLDATERALKYASEGEFDLLLTHHPMIFRKLEAVTPGHARRKQGSRGFRRRYFGHFASYKT